MMRHETSPRHFFQQGIEAFRKGIPGQAEAFFQKSVEAAPGQADVWFWLGLALAQQARMDESVTAFSQAAVLEPTNADYQYNLGLAMQHGGDISAACGCYEKAVSLRPGYADAWYNLGVARQSLGLESGAISAYDHLLSLEISSADRRFALEMLYGLSFILLARGKWTSIAWKAYESRWDFRSGFQRPETPFPQWDGQSPQGKRLLIWPEQGFGDNIMMFRYALWLAQQGALVTVLASPLLRSLFQRQHENVKVVSTIDPKDFYDGHRPMMGLLEALQVTPSSILSPSCYLHSRPESRPDWPLRGLQVGVVWSGGSNTGHDPLRSLSHLRALSPLLAIPGIFWHSLQKGAREDECLEFGIPQPSKAFNDFDDTAAVIRHLDLVITVDTAVAHLAGALGKPVWILLPTPAEWRWYPYGETTQWYPSARLFIQKTPGDWDEVILRVKLELAKKAAQR
jgi:tetratricopeptide (TPR) repeat protein